MVCFQNNSSHKKRVLLRIIFDIVCIAVVGAGILAIKFGFKPYTRGYFCNDESLMHPYLSDTVSVPLAVCVGILLPVGTILGAEFILRHSQTVCIITPKGVPKVRSWLLAAYGNIIVFLFGAAVTQFLTEVGKYSIGRQRPHFLTLCKPPWGSVNCSNFVDGNMCTSVDDDKMTEARLSFPSGHSSFSMYCMMYAILYMQGRMSCQSVLFLRPVIQLVFFSLAFYTCLSRVSDYKHHWSDVLAGAILGMVIAIFVVLCLTEFGKGICLRGGSCGFRPDKVEPSPRNSDIKDTEYTLEEDSFGTTRAAQREFGESNNNSHVIQIS